MVGSSRAQTDIDYWEVVMVAFVAVGLALVMLIIADLFFDIPMTF